MMKGTIFDIKHFAIHDGPGIRTTVFLKGCPLECWWCHNPEGISPKKQIVHQSQRCIDCNACLQVCQNDAISFIRNQRNSTRKQCTLCQKCAETCPTGALQIIGREVTIEELMNEIKKDTLYFDTSNGGVTFSGGEPLMQPDFLERMLKKCKDAGIQTILDTSGYASQKVFTGIMQHVDRFLYDIKLLDNAQHRKYTNVSNQPILNNLQSLLDTGRGDDLILRFPVIPGITDTADNLKKLTSYVSSHKEISKIDLLPFHNVAEKYERIGKSYRMKAPTPSFQGKIEQIQKQLQNAREDLLVRSKA